MTSRRIIVATAGGPHPWIIINALREHFPDLVVVEEEGESRGELIRRRARRSGWISALGQAATMAWSVLSKKLFRRRIERLIAEEGLRPHRQGMQDVRHVSSVNGRDFLDLLKSDRPAVLFLVGCRLLRRETLAAIPCPVLNYHAGITPLYRGMNGGYWAMAEGDAANFGGTVHLVDAGVDTGEVLYQARGRPKQGDTIATYAYRQAALSRRICIDAVRDALEGRLAPMPVDLPSRLWFHPTIWRYVWTGLTRGVW